MNPRVLQPVPLTAERFAPYGDVISGAAAGSKMNEARFERYDDLASIDIDSSGGGRVSMSIARSRTATAFPYHFDLVERHPLGSQAFVPLGVFSFVIVVAPPGESVEPDNLRAFVTNGKQGINYHRGTWHMPLIANAPGQEFLVIDRSPGDGNCEELVLDQVVVLAAP